MQDAAKCLENDPILTGRTVSEIDDNGYLMNRQVHLNYYAVKGLMARVYLYKGDYANAEVCAKEVIGSGCFEWVKQENLTNESVADLTFSTEHLFALNIVTLGNIVDKYLDGGNNSFALEESRLSEYYGSSYDYLMLLVLQVRQTAVNWDWKAIMMMNFQEQTAYPTVMSMMILMCMKQPKMP